MAGPELIVDNTEDICFPEPELKIENAGGPVAVRFRCEKCGEVGQAFEGPQTYFVKLRGMAEEQFLTEQACDLARRSAAAEQQPAGEEATTEGSEPRRREEEVEKVVHWEESSDHAPGDLLRKIARAWSGRRDPGPRRRASGWRSLSITSPRACTRRSPPIGTRYRSAMTQPRPSRWSQLARS